MKKIIALILIVIVTTWWQGCKVRKHIIKTNISVDSTKIVSSSVEVKSVDKDSSWNDFINIYNRRDVNTDLSINRIEKTVIEEPETKLLFKLNVDEIKVDGDTLTAVDVNTGTIAKAYKDKTTGQMLFDIKGKGRKTSTYELNGLNLRSNQRIDSGSIISNVGATSLVTKDSNAFSRDSTTIKSHSEAVQKSIKKDFGLLKTIGIIVIVLAVLRLAIWLLRNQFPWLGFLNNKLKF